MRAEVALSINARKEQAKQAAAEQAQPQAKALGPSKEEAAASTMEEEMRGAIELSLKKGPWATTASFLKNPPPRYEAMLKGSGVRLH